MVPIFKTGTHTSREGRTRTYTEADLDRFASTYNGQAPAERHDAPAVLGHPKTDGPAWGFFSGIKRVGDILYGSLRDAHPKFIDTVKAGHYRKVSPKFDSNGLLKHVGWLGAQAPAVKGLPEFSFSEEGKGECYEIDLTYSEPDDEMSDKNNTENGATATESGNGTAATDPNKETNTEQTPATTPPSGDGGSAPAGVTVEEFAEYKANQKKENDRIAAELAAERRKVRDMEFSEFLGSDKLRGRVTPAMKPGLTRLMHTLADSGETYEFSEGDETVKRTALDELKAVIEQLPVQVSFGEMATDGPEAGGSEFSEAENKELEELVEGVGGY